MPTFNPKDSDPDRKGINDYSYMSDDKLYNTIMEFLEADPKSYTLTGNRTYMFSVKQMVIAYTKRLTLEKRLFEAGIKSRESHTKKLMENP